jgi:hypothetical protein
VRNIGCLAAGPVTGPDYFSFRFVEHYRCAQPMLLDRAQYLYRWSQYAGDALAFDPAEDPIEVLGTARRRPGAK